jgi:hypothetical protein
LRGGVVVEAHFYRRVPYEARGGLKYIRVLVNVPGGEGASNP